MVDLASGKTLGYKQSTANYTASSMKGPVIMADFEQGVLNPAATDVATAQLVQNAIVNSDNNSYQQLIDSYGVGALHNWTAGVNINTELGRTKYWWFGVAGTGMETFCSKSVCWRWSRSCLDRTYNTVCSGAC